tara:strand:- start:6362 stop:8407 length:2046 start_codon:yes stop_codon:yes gene_type:complete
MPTARFQPSFAAGVLGPGLHGRIDIAKYDVALKVGKNVFVHAHGGVSNRTGLEFICEVMDSSKLHRLLPFTRDDDENYIMLMGDTVMQIIEGGAVLQDGGADYTPSTPYSSSHLSDLDYVQSIDVMFFAHNLVFPQKMSRSSSASWTFAGILTSPNVAAPTGVSVTPENATGTEEYSYKVSAIIDGVEGEVSTEASTAVAENLINANEENVIAWTGTADEFNVYRERNGIFGYIGFTAGNTFTDDNISADLEITPIEASEEFLTTGDYPAAVTMFQQRLIFGNTINEPETIISSRTGDFENFTRSRILRDTDRIKMDLSGEQVNRIRSMLQLRELLVFSSAGEFSVTGPNGILLATSPAQTQYGYSGSSTVKPLVVEDTALFVDRTTRSVRDLRYAFEQDGYSGNDLTIFSSHFFEGKSIAGWAYAKNPYSIVWVYLDDGSLLSFTYKREHQVWAWCEHDVSGDVESIAVVPEGREDAVYMIVKRTIDGQTKRYVERMHDRNFDEDAPEDCFFVDSGKTYEGTDITALAGMEHLEGETLVALVDGNVVSGLVVSGGGVSLPYPAQKVHIGLGYTSEIENLPPAIDLKDLGSARGRPVKVSRLWMQVQKTRGIRVSTTDRQNFNDYVQTGGDLAASIPLFTGLLDLRIHPSWGRDGTVVVQQPYPLPMSILGLSPDITVGRS